VRIRPTVSAAVQNPFENRICRAEWACRQQAMDTPGIPDRCGACMPHLVGLASHFLSLRWALPLHDDRNARKPPRFVSSWWSPRSVAS